VREGVRGRGGVGGSVVMDGAGVQIGVKPYPVHEGEGLGFGLGLGPLGGWELGRLALDVPGLGALRG